MVGSRLRENCCWLCGVGVDRPRGLGARSFAISRDALGALKATEIASRYHLVSSSSLVALQALSSFNTQEYSWTVVPSSNWDSWA